MLDSIDQPIPSTLPRATPVHWPTQEAHEIRMAQTSCIRCSTREMRQTILKYLTQISQTNSTGTLYTNIHRLRQCMRDASFALTLIYPYLCPSSLVQRHNSGWCDWESEPLPESLLLHHSRPESLSWHLCNVDHDWSWLIDIKPTYWFNIELVHSYQLMPWSQLLHRARGLCTPEICDEELHSRSDMNRPLRESTEPTACLPNLASYNKTNTTQRHTMTMIHDRNTNRLKGVSGEWRDTKNCHTIDLFAGLKPPVPAYKS